MTINTVNLSAANLPSAAKSTSANAADSAASPLAASEGDAGISSGLPEGQNKGVAFSTLLSEKLAGTEDAPGLTVLTDKEALAVAATPANPAVDPNAVNIALQQIGAAMNGNTSNAVSAPASGGKAQRVELSAANTKPAIAGNPVQDTAVETKAEAPTNFADEMMLARNAKAAAVLTEEAGLKMENEEAPVKTAAAPAPALPVTVAAKPAEAPVNLGTVQVPIHSPRFAEATAERVKFAIGNNIQSAQIDLHPAELGPISITVQMNKSDASISFGATLPETRQALENAIPRLRELLAQAGIALSDAQVGNQTFAQQQQTSAQNQRGSSSVSASETEAVTTITRPLNRNQEGSGLLDMYA